MGVLLSEAATVDDGGVAEKVIVVADVKKAFYEALAKREMAMELPEEDLMEEERLDGIVGELVLAMPGTRDAANSWQEEVIYLDMTFEEASKFIVSAGTSETIIK